MGCLTQAVSSLCELDDLSLECYDKDFTAWDSLLDSHLLNAVLMHARSLRVLHLDCYLPNFLVPLDNLQHVMLSVARILADDCLAALASAHNPKSLLVTSNRERETIHRPLGGLDFSSLSKLEAVSLRYITPKRLMLPEQCKLAVVVSSMTVAKAAVWHCKQLQAFHITCAESSIDSLDNLPRILLEGEPKGRNAGKVQLSCASFGSYEHPLLLGQGLAHVQR